MGWNTSLTSDDVHRRLPCDGHLWRKQQQVLTPYFGIWDKSAGRIGNPIGFIPQYSSPEQADEGLHASTTSPTSPGPTQNFQPTDMSTVGAFAYCIEATESMSRVMSYFLQQKVNLSDQREVSSWLTRFKELDLRLVHWKMLLPQKWKSNPNMTRHVPLMDPNLTLAHVTHNASMILLHQLIAFPPMEWQSMLRLPSECSVEACYSAGIGIATITQNYLVNSQEGSPIASQYAFCVFIAARMLLLHWRYRAGNVLSDEFWSLVNSLDEMSRRWRAFAQHNESILDLAGKYAASLRNMHDLCIEDGSFHIHVMDYTNEIDHSRGGSHRQAKPKNHQSSIPAPFDQRGGPQFNSTQWPDSAVEIKPTEDPLSTMSVELPNARGLNFRDLEAFPQMTLDQSFLDMDRIITFDDGSMFAATLDTSLF